MSKEKIGRIAEPVWMEQRADHAFAVYNADYTYDNRRILSSERPWHAIGPGAMDTFTTHAEALAWAFEKAEAGK